MKPSLFSLAVLPLAGAMLAGAAFFAPGQAGPNALPPAAAAPNDRPDRTGPRPNGGEWQNRNTDEAQAFFKAHSPYRYSLYEKMNDDRKRNVVLRQMASNFTNLRWLKNQDEELYTNKVSQIEVEDEIFKASQAVKDKSMTPAEAEGPLHDAVEKLFDLRLKEQKGRIDRLEKSLEVMHHRYEAQAEAKELHITDSVAKAVAGDLAWMQEQGNGLAPGRDGREGPGRDGPSTRPGRGPTTRGARGSRPDSGRPDGPRPDAP